MLNQNKNIRSEKNLTFCRHDVTMRVQNIDGAGEVDGCILHLNYQNIL